MVAELPDDSTAGVGVQQLLRLSEKPACYTYSSSSVISRMAAMFQSEAELAAAMPPHA